jgi:hypothetical protein
MAPCGKAWFAGNVLNFQNCLGKEGVFASFSASCQPAVLVFRVELVLASKVMAFY